MPYQPNRESVQTHPVPAWFEDAKLGIFIHWGLYSVPAWAPNAGELHEVVAREGWAGWFARNPYAEWYMNSYQVQGGATQEHHLATYGPDFQYRDFAPLFDQATQRWDPDSWAALFQQAGARYAVLTTKHHDGFLLWPSRTPNPFVPAYHAARDLVGELTAAVRRRGMTMGLYYSGGLDWTFNTKVIQDIADIPAAVPQSPDYIAYANSHWRELIDRYETRVLWNDIAYPAATDLNLLFADYYNRLPDGVVNNRFTQRFQFSEGNIASDNHFDFETPEYASFGEIRTKKWESCRGIGASFGYNRNEGPDQYQSVDALVHMLVDIVSKNGNLLLNIGPAADGAIPALQRERLLGLGQWLAINGDGIYGTRPWVVAEGKTDGRVDVRFTQKAADDALYAFLLGKPVSGRIAMQGIQAAPNTRVELLGHDVALDWVQSDAGLTVELPQTLPDAPAYGLRVTPRPQLAG